MPERAESFALVPKYQRARVRKIVLTLKSYSKACPSQLIWSLIFTNVCFYWTDRGDPPRGNTVNRASIDGKPKNQSPEILLTHLMEGIGISLDRKGERIFVTDLGGSIYSAKLDGSDKKTLL